MNPSISDNGRYVVFMSWARNLVNDDTNHTNDIFVHDRQTGQTNLVSIASDGTQGNSGSGYPAISSNGRYVAFESYASNLVNGDTNSTKDIFLHDRQTGQTKRVSVASDGTEGNSMSTYTAISGDGRYVAFHSWATNLVSNDTNDSAEAFIHEWQTGQTRRIALKPNGTQGNSESGFPFVSANGRYITFYADASNLVSGDSNNQGDIFIHE